MNYKTDNDYNPAQEGIDAVQRDKALMLSKLTSLTPQDYVYVNKHPFFRTGRHKLNAIFDRQIDRDYPEPITLLGGVEYDQSVALKILDPDLYAETFRSWLEEQVALEYLFFNDGQYYYWDFLTGK